jgi:alpha-ketoglutarate-dependent taurine dioxygenase
MSLPASHLTYPSYTADSFVALLDRHGYVYMDEVPGDFDHVSFCEKFGPLTPQYNGDLVFSVLADERYDHLNHPLTTHAMLPHTDGYEFEGEPPRYLALWCLVPPSDGGGKTTLGDLYAFVKTLGDEERRELASRRYRFVSGIEETEVDRSAMYPVLEERGERPPIVRFSYDFVEHDEFLAEINERMLSYFDRNHVAVAYEPNALLLWDNHRMVHGRTGFLDRERHLRRVWLREG